MKSLWWFPWPFLPIRNSWDSTILTSALTPKEEDSGYLKLDRAPVYVYARRWEGSAETDPHANFQRGLALPVLLFSIQRISQIETGQSRAGLTSPSWRPTDILLGFKVHNCSLFPLSQSLSLSFFNTLENNINPISQKRFTIKNHCHWSWAPWELALYHSLLKNGSGHLVGTSYVLIYWINEKHLLCCHFKWLQLYQVCQIQAKRMWLAYHSHC